LLSKICNKLLKFNGESLTNDEDNELGSFIKVGFLLLLLFEMPLGLAHNLTVLFQQQEQSSEFSFFVDQKFKHTAINQSAQFSHIFMAHMHTLNLI
jgi:hypothetical protein